MSRWYRESIKNGQTSPCHLATFAVDRISYISLCKNRPLSLLDVGCGSGEQFDSISNRIGLEKINKKIGIEWSPAAVEKHKTKTIFDNVVHCQSERLPFSDREFDIVTSIENLEHLYVEDVITAIEELKRVAEYIILITPLPKDIINYWWLCCEIAEAKGDREFLGFEEFMGLEGAVHKSTVYPSSMIEAGFAFNSDVHGFYFAKSTNIDISKIKCAGMIRRNLPSKDCDFGEHYLSVLVDSLTMRI
jgi:SAM-dependent methyltransferase